MYYGYALQYHKRKQTHIILNARILHAKYREYLFYLNIVCKTDRNKSKRADKLCVEITTENVMLCHLNAHTSDQAFWHICSIHFLYTLLVSIFHSSTMRMCIRLNCAYHVRWQQTTNHTLCVNTTTTKTDVCFCIFFSLSRFFFWMNLCVVKEWRRGEEQRKNVQHIVNKASNNDPDLLKIELSFIDIH